MPYAVTAFSVKIATPSETAVEARIVHEVIVDWNATHALRRSLILLPLDNSEGATGPLGDLLIAFFSAAEDDSMTVALATEEGELEAHLAAGRPTLIYFSKARVNLLSTQGLRTRAVEDIRRSYPLAAVDSYGDEKELRAKVGFQLDATVSCHAYFQNSATTTSVVAAPVVTAPAISAAPLSEHARLILSEACDDFEAYIGRIKVGDTLRIQANGKQLVEQGNPEVASTWDRAFQELLQGGFIRDAGCNGQLFQISAKGFEFLRSLGKTPVGYIAEMGGM